MKKDFEMMDKRDIAVSWSEVGKITGPPLYPHAIIVINAWCFSDCGYYGGEHISFGYYGYNKKKVIFEMMKAWRRDYIDPNKKEEEVPRALEKSTALKDDV